MGILVVYKDIQGYTWVYKGIHEQEPSWAPDMDI